MEPRNVPFRRAGLDAAAVAGRAVPLAHGHVGAVVALERGVDRPREAVVTVELRHLDARVRAHDMPAHPGVADGDDVLSVDLAHGEARHVSAMPGVGTRPSVHRGGSPREIPANTPL